MTNEPDELRGELKEQIQAFVAESSKRIPPEIFATFRQATEELVKSGIAEHGLKKGAQASRFNLPNVRGESVALSRLLTQGPAVVAFYRGVW